MQQFGGMEDRMERLSEKEQKLFFIILNNCEGVFFTDMHSMFEKKIGKKYARTTILTFLNRMEKKGYIRRERIGRTTKVIPLVSRETYIRSEIIGLCSDAFNGNVERMIELMKGQN